MNVPSAFNARMIIGVIAAGILALIAFLFLSTYAPPMGGGSDGGAHALSKSAIGYAGLVELLTEEGQEPALVRDTEGLKTDGLLVLTPDVGGGDDLGKIIRERGQKPTLIVLPAYNATLDTEHKGWVTQADPVPTQQIEQLLSSIDSVQVQRVKSTMQVGFDTHPASFTLFAPPQEVQTITGRGITPLIKDKDGNALLARIGSPHFSTGDTDGEYNIFILADPDMLNNLGLSDSHRAYAATKILASLAPAGHPQITFDLTLNGFGHERSLLDMIMRPPFLAMTIALLVAALMALLNGLVRFGPAMAEVRALPRGKGALVANTADLFKLAKLEHQLGGRYVALIRDLAGAQLGLPPSMSAAARDARFDALKHRAKFSDLAQKAEQAGNRAEMLTAAQALDHWRRGE